MKISTQWLLALCLVILPFAALLPMGALWLWEQQGLFWWLGIGALISIIGLVWRDYLRRCQITILTNVPKTDPNQQWSYQGQAAWHKIVIIAEAVKIEDYPLDNQERLFSLGRKVLETVANHYHPDSPHALLETPIPYVLRVIELVSADLRTNFVAHIPGSHIITISDIFRGHHLSSLASKYYDVYRVLSLPVNPVGALLRELKGFLTKKVFNAATDNVKLWLLQNYVKKVGYYAIELYSGALVLDNIAFQQYTTPYSQQDLQTAEKTSTLQEEPLRILVLGQVKAGKSSLINALFGDTKAATDILPLTQHITPYLLVRDGINQAMIFDSVGYEDQHSTLQFFDQVTTDILRSDFILLVCKANNPARQPDKQILNELYHLFQKQLDTPIPPILVILTHIDQLRPVREWQPPYNVANPDTPKAQAIRQAMESVSHDLQIELSHIIPVNLKSEAWFYNVEEGVIPAILNQLDKAKRAQYLRCVKLFKQQEYWEELWAQTYQAGKIVVNLASKVTTVFDEWKKGL